MIDVIIPCYNHASTLPAAVRSVSVPGVMNVWVVDDASTDDTLDVANALAEVNPRVHVLPLAQNMGCGAARTMAACLSAMPFIAFLDADDVYHIPDPQEGFHPAMRLMVRHDLSVLRLPLEMVGLPERYTSHPQYAEALHRVYCNGMVARRGAFLAIGGMVSDVTRQFGGEDQMLYNVMLSHSRVGQIRAEQDPLMPRYQYHAEHATVLRYFDHALFGIWPEEITEEVLARGEFDVRRRRQSLDDLAKCLAVDDPGVYELE